MRLLQWFFYCKAGENLSISEASILLGVSRWTIQRLIKQAKVSGSKIGGRTIIKKIEIDKLFNIEKL